MSSFLKKLKKKNINPPSSENQLEQNHENAAELADSHTDLINTSQLNIDVLQTKSAILIYAQVSGSSVHDFSVSVEGDNDVVVIKGRRVRPNGDVFPDNDGEHNQNNCVLEECSWGEFYRQIILPTEVDSSKAEAKIKNGVLVARLPLKESSSNGVRINVTEV